MMNPKKLFKQLNNDSTIQEYYINGKFEIHPIFQNLFNTFTQMDEISLFDNIKKLYTFEDYPHNMYTKLCLTTCIFPYITNEEQAKIYFNRQFWDIFLQKPNDTTSYIKLDTYFEAIMGFMKNLDKNHQNDDSYPIYYILLQTINPEYDNINKLNTIWPLIDLLSKNASYKQWNKFIIKLDSYITEQLNHSHMTLHGRFCLIILLKFASMCRFNCYRYSSSIHLKLSRSLLDTIFKFKLYSNEFQMIGNAFLNSLMPHYSQNNDDPYFNLVLISKKYLNVYPSNTRMKIILMLKILKAIRLRFLLKKDSLDFLHVCYAIYFLNLLQPTNHVGTFRDILISYKHYRIEIKSNKGVRPYTISKSKPYWLDVIIEIILSLLVYSNKWIKKMCITVFNHLAIKNIRRSTWKILCNSIITPETLLSLEMDSGKLTTTDSFNKNNLLISPNITTSNLTDSSFDYNSNNDIMIDDATPEQLAELEKLSDIIRGGNPKKNTSKQTTITLYRTFQFRVLGLLTLVEKFHPTLLEVIEYTHDLIEYCVRFKPKLTSMEDKNFIKRLFLVIECFLDIKRYPLNTYYNDKIVLNLTVKLIKKIDKHFIEYLYKMRNHIAFADLWIKLLYLLNKHVLESNQINTHYGDEFGKIFLKIHLHILNDFLYKRNPVVKQIFLSKLLSNPSMDSRIRFVMIDRLIDCLCTSTLRVPKLVAITYTLSSGLKVLVSDVDNLFDYIPIKQKWKTVLSKFKILPKNPKINKNLSQCSCLIEKVGVLAEKN